MPYMTNCACFYFKFSLAPCNIYRCSDWWKCFLFILMMRFLTVPLQGFYASQHIAHKLNSSRGDFQRVVGVQVGYIGVSQCPLMHCPENYSCQTVYKPQNKQIRIMSERTTYTSYEHSRSHACMCNRDAGKIMRKLVVYDSFGRI